jgi:hypothetical protein
MGAVWATSMLTEGFLHATKRGGYWPPLSFFYLWAAMHQTVASNPRNPQPMQQRAALSVGIPILGGVRVAVIAMGEPALVVTPRAGRVVTATIVAVTTITPGSSGIGSSTVVTPG